MSDLILDFEYTHLPYASSRCDLYYYTTTEKSSSAFLIVVYPMWLNPENRKYYKLIESRKDKVNTYIPYYFPYQGHKYEVRMLTTIDHTHEDSIWNL